MSAASSLTLGLGLKHAAIVSSKAGFGEGPHLFPRLVFMDGPASDHALTCAVGSCSLIAHSSTQLPVSQCKYRSRATAYSQLPAKIPASVNTAAS